MFEQSHEGILTSVEVEVPAGHIQISGTTAGVIVLVALIGMIVVSMKAIGMSERVMKRSTDDRDKTV